jgi:hypothetical protein
MQMALDAVHPRAILAMSVEPLAVEAPEAPASVFNRGDPTLPRPVRHRHPVFCFLQDGYNLGLLNRDVCMRLLVKPLKVQINTFNLLGELSR